MDQQAAYWFLSTVAQVTAALSALYFLGFVFWAGRGKMPTSSFWRRIVVVLFIASVAFGSGLALMSIQTITWVPNEDMGTDVERRVDVITHLFFWYTVVLSMAVGLLVVSTLFPRYFEEGEGERSPER